MADHYRVAVWVETYEDVGGVRIPTGGEWQNRCGCTQSLEHDFGHEASRPTTLPTLDFAKPVGHDGPHLPVRLHHEEA